MLKIILRIVIILAVFAAVAGGVYLLVQNSGSSILGSTSLEGGFRDNGGAGHFDQGQPPAGGQRPGGGNFDREGGSGNWSQLAVNFGKIALITIGVVLFQNLIKFFRHRKTSKESVTA